MTMRVLVVNGAYRKEGATDQLVEVVCRVLKQRGVETDMLVLRDVDIGFCINCRACTQQPGEAPGACVLRDAMGDVVRRIEASDAFVLASPTNVGSVTAIFRRLIERLVVYGYWPWGMAAPKYRKAGARKKKAVLIATCGAPGILGGFAFSTQKQLAAAAKLLGAKVCGALFSGLHAQTPASHLTPAQIKRAERLAEKLF
jgi:multimeric flavodoxin WrbA